MDEHEHFNSETIKELGNYVYRLIDPRNGETFYVGKGNGNRVFAHVNDDTKLMDKLAHEGTKDNDQDVDDDVSRKMERIREIRRSGMGVIHIIHRHKIPDTAVFDVEAALIDAFTGLTNIAGGHGSNDHGPMHTKQIIDKYQLPTIDVEPEHKLVLLNINLFEGSSREDIYHQTRLSWKISKRKAEQADYVLAVIRGVVVGAFVAEKWKPATKEHFPELANTDSDRLGFIGTQAPDSIWNKYVGKRGKRIAIEGMKHVQNPIRYWNIM